MTRAILCGGVTGCLFFAMLSTVASAHPGHGVSDGQTAGHYLTEPSHLLPVVAVAVLAVAVSLVVGGLLRARRGASGQRV